ncbi:hypothetical protein Desti_2045 [Desulfomonile tiedjei DSM 6799]|uniref:Uncharacterized protein n=1 Tax=Desulfomonile tiedjei (strain ATCC 49306 / DSM 6799 / DCB-1) TaxID=706587 RepID=I4C5A7_DESTA|nr:hypothetical protein Desti_2045 [Desulfomonile tiedjei DSM 6799]
MPVFRCHHGYTIRYVFSQSIEHRWLEAAAIEHSPPGIPLKHEVNELCSFSERKCRKEKLWAN